MGDTRLSRVVQALVLFLLIVLAVQLGGIWAELRHIRSEQVKNKFYSLPEEYISKISKITDKRKDLIKKQYECTTFVEVNGTVDVEVQNQPVEVEVSP